MVMEQCGEDEFLKLSTKFMFLNTADSEKSKIVEEELNTILNDLNSLDYKQTIIADQSSAVRLIKSLLNIPNGNKKLLIKSCGLIVSLVGVQKVVIPGSDVGEVAEWLFRGAENTQDEVICDILCAARVLLKQRADCIPELLSKLIGSNGILLKLLDNGSTRVSSKNIDHRYSVEDIQISAAYCLESLLTVSDEMSVIELSTDQQNAIGRAILDFLYSARADKFGASNFIEVTMSLLNSYQYLCTISKSFSAENLGEILGAITAFMMCFTNEEINRPVQKVVVSQQGVLDPTVSSAPKKGGKVSKVRKPRVTNKSKGKVEVGNLKSNHQSEENGRKPFSDINIEFDIPRKLAGSKTSESDYSESESSRAQHDLRRFAKLRYSALALLCVLAKNIEKKILFGYWHCLLSPSVDGISLPNSILRDPNPRCRIVALQALSILLYGSRPFLAQAESSAKTPATFMPFSIALGNTLKSIYESLSKAVVTESSLPVLAQILKCLAVLFRATSFRKLETGIVQRVVDNIRPLITHKDNTISVAALMAVGFLLSTPDITPEILESIGLQKNALSICNVSTQPVSADPEIYEADLEFESESCEFDSPEAASVSMLNLENEPSSWLLHIVFANLGVSVSTNEVIKATTLFSKKAESVRILAAIGTHYILLKDHIPLITTALVTGFSDVLDMRFYVARCFDMISHGMNLYLQESAKNLNEGLTIANMFWLTLIPEVIKQLQDSTLPASYRAICCDGLANIGSHVFERMPHFKQMLLISILSGCSLDEDTIVCAAAVRALAVYALFPSLCENVCFLENTSESILRLIDKPILLARIKASWALGNISEALMTEKTSNFREQINENLLKSIYESAIKAADDNDKVRSNIMRTLGNLLRFATQGNISNLQWEPLIVQSIEKLVRNASGDGNMKVKWNACYSIGNFMRNEVLFDPVFSKKWKAMVFSALCDLIVRSPNFKVRINASAAIAVPKLRSLYGQFFIEIWKAHIVGLEEASHLTDYNEYKHRDTLMEQLCINLSQCLHLSTANDLILMCDELVPFLDATQASWNRVINHSLPEKVSQMSGIAEKLKSIESQLVTGEQKSALRTLQLCFVATTLDAP